MITEIPPQAPQGLFQKLNALITRPKAQPDRSLIGHAREQAILDQIMANFRQCEAGDMTIEFIDDYHVTMRVLRGGEVKGYGTSGTACHITAPDDIAVDDPALTIHMAGALRESMQEYDPHLKKPGVEVGEKLFIHRMTKKLEDKLFWQTVIVYEMGKLLRKDEFLDSFTIMGYYNLIEGYEKDLEEANQS